MPKRSIFFLIVIGLFGVGLSFLINTLDPILYTEKVRQIAPPHLKNTVLSGITITALLVALIVQPLVGHWSDRTHSPWGQRVPYLTGGVVGLSFSLILIFVADDLWLLIIAVMLTSAFSNTVQSVWQALIPDQVSELQHGTASGIKTLLEIIGAVTGVTVVAAAITAGRLWLAPGSTIGLFWAILVLTLYTLWQAGAWQPERLGDKTGQSSDSGQISNLPERTLEAQQKLGAKLWQRARGWMSELPVEFVSAIRRQPAFAWWIVNRVVFWSSGIAIRTFLLNYLEDGLSLPLAEIQSLSNRLGLALGIGVVLLVLLAGALADRLGRRPLLMAAGLIASTGTILLVTFQGATVLFLAVGLIAGGAGIFASASWALATDLVPKKEGALYLGVANIATVVGSIGGRLGGPLIDGLNQITQTSTIGYLVIFAIAALFFAVSSLIILKIPEPYESPGT